MQDLLTFDIGLHEVCVRTGVRYVITKFSGMDGLPNFLTHGAPLRARGSSAIKAGVSIRDKFVIMYYSVCTGSTSLTIRNLY